ncbi:cytochrome P450 [Gymnopus androsaceus JB14]|uniref:Cytochrome P450 n=1 Tax=Gymnopus androsaceus JB14 TaxID=1447944 RepID=A0A6A4HWJ5_9AGAR|nr:cytochrome P450 [Gymnopus androsaceus JB14]
MLPLISAIVLAAVLWLFIPFLRLLSRQWLSPLRFLPGPPSQSFFMGNLAEMHEQENTNLIANWEAKYGSTFVYRGFVGGCRLMTTDPVAVAHILGNAYEYPKPDFVRDSLATMAAGHDGLLTTEGEMHKKQTPAFTSSHIKSLAPIFWDHALQLRDIWFDLASNSETIGHSSTRVDALIWLGRATLDVIGLAGFGYSFHSLAHAHTQALPSESSDELADAFSTIFSTARKFRVMTILQVWFPWLRRFRRNSAVMVQAQETMRRIGLGLIDRATKEAVDDEKNGWKNETGIEGDKTTMGRDLLAVLIRSSLSQRDATSSSSMSTSEILSQISTFLAAGHETTASALNWCLYALVKHPDAQIKLRQSLRELEADFRSVDDNAIQKCEFLDWVVRESLRVHAPVTSTMRVCMREGGDDIPVSRDGYRDKYGSLRSSIPVNKHDIISVPIQAINKSKDLWGEDAGEFKPERWASPPERVKSIPGLYSNILTFLNGNPIDGNRACIGYKFALIEMKIFLYVLVKDIEFSIDPALVIEKKVNVVTRPFVKSEPHLGNQMPLYIRPATKS